MDSRDDEEVVFGNYRIFPGPPPIMARLRGAPARTAVSFGTVEEVVTFLPISLAKTKTLRRLNRARSKQSCLNLDMGYQHAMNRASTSDVE